jgi:hypothetical protein
MVIRLPRFVPFPLLVIGLFSVSACAPFWSTMVTGSGHVRSEQRTVSGFDHVAFAGDGELTITQGSVDSLIVEADDNLLPYLTSSVSANTLHLGRQSNVTFLSATTITFIVTVKQLQGLTMSGAGNATVNNLVVPSFHVTLSGAGRARIIGSADSQSLSLSGAGTYDGSGFATKSATVEVNGAGNALVEVSETLTATVSGVGSVAYIGNPKVTQHITGAGGVHQQ